MFCVVLVITCFPQEPPINGQFRNIAEDKYGSILAVDCKEGYFLVGNPTIQCGDIDQDGLGEWNGTLGFCRGKHYRDDLFK